MVDDVLRDVLLGARELVEPRSDVRRESLVAAGLVRGLRRGRSRPLHWQAAIRRRARPFPQRAAPETNATPPKRDASGTGPDASGCGPAGCRCEAGPRRGEGAGRGYVRRVRPLAVVVRRYPGFGFAYSRRHLGCRFPAP